MSIGTFATSFLEHFGLRAFGGWQRTARPGMEEGMFAYDESTAELFESCAHEEVTGREAADPVNPEAAAQSLNESELMAQVMWASVYDKKRFEAAVSVLTSKEILIIELVHRGCTNREIASRLNIAEQTVKAYLSAIYEKVGVSNRLELFLATREAINQAKTRRSLQAMMAAGVASSNPASKPVK